MVTAMNIVEVTQFSHNLLGQFQAEQIFTTGIASVVHSHAVDLDEFNKMNKKLGAEVTDIELKLHQFTSEMETNLVKMYERIKMEVKQEQDEKYAHARAGARRHGLEEGVRGERGRPEQARGEQRE